MGKHSKKYIIKCNIVFDITFPFQIIQTFENSLATEFFCILILLSNLLDTSHLHDLINDDIWGSHSFKFQTLIFPCFITLNKLCNYDSTMKYTFLIQLLGKINTLLYAEHAEWYQGQNNTHTQPSTPHPPSPGLSRKYPAFQYTAKYTMCLFFMLQYPVQHEK